MAPPPGKNGRNHGQHDPAEVVRRAYAAWNCGDLRGVVQLTHPDFEWGDPPEIVDARGGSGRKAFEDYLRRLAHVWDELRWKPEEFWTAGELLLVVVTGVGRGKRSGAVVTGRFFHVWRVEDGRARRMDGYMDERDALECLKAAGRQPRGALRLVPAAELAA
jgi:ketosteroid isomerase-like protein